MKLKNTFLSGLLTALFLPGLLVAQDSEVFFATEPTISPDGSYVVFSYESDLWKVPTEGGVAVRLTAMDGFERAAHISPDGNWIAFSSNQYGNNDVFLMPVDGGEIQRLTYHQGSDVVESWNWDSQSLYFNSSRYNRISAFEVSISGGTPARLFEHYHNNVHNLLKHPDRNEYFFNESWESFIFPQRKRYKGSFNPDIKSYNLDTETYTAHTSWEGKDFQPTMDQNGNLYFTSDEFNNEYNLYKLENGSPQQLTRFRTSVKQPQVSANGEVIVFEMEYQLYTYNVASGRSQKIPISISRNFTLAKDQNFDVKGNISAFDVSEDGKKIAFISRGELFVSDIDGKFVRQIETDFLGRALEVKWLSDNKTLFFSQTYEGYQNWFSIAADGSGTATRHTSDSQNNRLLQLNSDRSKGVYLSGRNELKLIDMENFRSETIVEDEFWGFQNQPAYFSSNDEYILYTARRNFEPDVFTYHIEKEEIQSLTNTGVSEWNPMWSPDGKYIYFASTRVQPSYPRGAGATDLYRIALDRFEDPFKSDKFDELFAEKEKEDDDEEEKDEEETLKISINLDGLMERAERVGPTFGSQFVSYVHQDGDKTYLLFTSNHAEGRYHLYVTTFEPFKSPSTKKFDGITSGGTIYKSNGKLYTSFGGEIYSLNPGSAKASKIDIDYAFQRELKNEFYQMFYELWANIEENFYNETFHSIDWEAIRDRYEDYLPYVNNRADLRRMNNDMLGELNSSHMGFNTFGSDESEFYETVSLSTGIIFEKANPYTVSSIVTDGPSDVAGKDIQPGDVLVAVDGESVDNSMNRESYFTRPEMQEELTLTFRRDRTTYSTKIHPVSYFSSRVNLYDEWVDTNQQLVDSRTNNTVAYVHMKNMGGGELNNFLFEMTSEWHNREALIFDLRYNTGGNVHDDVLRFLSQRKYAEWKYREGVATSQSNFNPASKPIVLLINEQSLSDAEATTAGFKELGLGTVMGTETYRWIIFTSGKGLVDGSFYRLPSWGVYSLNGDNLESTGVAPDIEVHNNFKHRLMNEDPQLNQAIDFILEQMED